MRYVEFEDLITSRLRLRKLTMADVPAFFERIGGSEEVTKYMLFQTHGDISETVASIEKALRRYEAGKNYRFGIALRETDELIGMIEPLRFEEETSTCSFAYMLGKEFWGKGYGTEALNAVMDFLFNKMEMERVEADHMAENIGSGAVMRKVGMVYTGCIPGKYEKNGILYDAHQYEITRSQWLAK